MKYCLLLKWSLNIHPVDFLRNLFHYFHLSWRWVVHQLRDFQKTFLLSILTVFVCSCLPWIDRLAGWNASVLCWPAAWNKAGIIIYQTCLTWTSNSPVFLFLVSELLCELRCLLPLLFFLVSQTLNLLFQVGCKTTEIYHGQLRHCCWNNCWQR